MQKRILAITLCLIMVSAFAATSAVSAKNANNVINSSIRQYDVYYPVDQETAVVVGKITIDGETGHYVVNVNLERAGLKDEAQEHTILWVVLWNTNSFSETPSLSGYGLLIPTFINEGGIAHVEGTHELVQQWFGDGAVDGVSTLAEFNNYDFVAGGFPIAEIEPL